MNELICKHCGSKVESDEENCLHCGMPLPPEPEKTPQQKFTLLFIVLVIICVIMVFWLPRELTQYSGQ